VEFAKTYLIALTNLIFTLFSNKTIHQKTLVAKMVSYNQPYYLIKKRNNKVIRFVVVYFHATKVF
jgi:hypothetical protein